MYTGNAVYPDAIVRQPTFKKPFDYNWEQKPSTNGQFKYGLFECCSGPTPPCYVVLIFIMSVIIYPGWVVLAITNCDVAEVVGN